MAVGDVLSSFAAPGGSSDAVAFDGTNLISCDYTADLIYVHDGVSSTILGSFAAPSAEIRGLTFDGVNLISVDTSARLIYIHDGVSSTILDSFTAPGVFPTGLTFDGLNLISCDYWYGSIYVHDGVSSTILDSFTAPGGRPFGTAFDGTNLISCDVTTSSIYIHDGVSSTILDSFAAPVVPIGLVFTGANLLSSGSDSSFYIHEWTLSDELRFLTTASVVSIDAAHAAGELSFTTGGTATEFTAAHAAGELSFTTDNTHADVSALSVEQAAALSFTTDSVSTLIQARQLERLTYDSTKSVGLIIPDNDLTGITSTVNVSVDGEILGVSVDTSVTHPYSSDIVLALTSPSGTVFYPNDLAGSTALFNGESVVGDWTLHVYDQWEYDEGTLNSWTLNIEYHHGIDRAVFTTGAAVAVRADTGYLSAASTYERELYILQIDHDTLPSIRVPMSSFTVRQSEGGTAYLEANIPEYAQALDINARSGGSMSLFYVLDRGGFRSETIAYTTDDLTVRSNLGSSSASVTLSGTFTPAAGGDREIALSGSSYYSSGTTERVRCSFDPLIRIGDTVNSEESGAFVVVSTVYTITPETRTFEVSS